MMGYWNDRDMSSRATTGTLISGLVIAGVGVILLLDQTGVINANMLFRFWPLIFCVTGAIRLGDARRPVDQVWGGFLVCLGALLTLHEFGYIHFGLAQLWPLFLILAGVLLAWRANEAREGRGGARLPGKDGNLGSVSIFGNIERNVDGKMTDNGELVAIFGGFKVNLARAEMEGDEAVIDAVAIFGGGEIIVPEWWRVSVEGVGVFGAYVDKTRHIPHADRPVKLLHIRGAAVFGGVEIKSY